MNKDSIMYKTYGLESLQELKEIANEIASKYAYGANVDNLSKMLLETAITETNAGNAPMDTTRAFGRSIAQFDRIGYNEALRIRNQKGNKDFENEVNKGYMSDDLQFNPRFALYLMRFFYLGKSEAIPNTREGRAKYWKKYYNTSYGAGTPEHYLQLTNLHLGKE